VGYEQSTYRLVKHLKKEYGRAYNSHATVKVELIEDCCGLKKGQQGFTQDYMGSSWFVVVPGTNLGGYLVPKVKTKVLVRLGCMGCSGIEIDAPIEEV
jgi:hypothetical protein